MNDNNELPLGIITLDPLSENTITFHLSNPPEEVIRISKDGFYWKGNLVENSIVIYERFKEWLDNSNHSKQSVEVTKLGTIEEYQNFVELLKEALKFYANKDNYTITNPTMNGKIFSYVEMDCGSQARFALQKAEELAKLNQKMQDDYDKIMSTYELLQNTDSIADPNELIKMYTNLNNDKNI